MVGRSAGGHLAMWSGARHRLPAKSALRIPNPLPLRGVVNLAGTIDMTENIANMESLCRDTVVKTLLVDREVVTQGPRAAFGHVRSIWWQNAEIQISS